MRNNSFRFSVLHGIRYPCFVLIVQKLTSCMHGYRQGRQYNVHVQKPKSVIGVKSICSIRSTANILLVLHSISCLFFLFWPCFNFSAHTANEIQVDWQRILMSHTSVRQVTASLSLCSYNNSWQSSLCTSTTPFLILFSSSSFFDLNYSFNCR